MLSSFSEGNLVLVGVFLDSGINTSQSSGEGQEWGKEAKQEDCNNCGGLMTLTHHCDLHFPPSPSTCPLSPSPLNLTTMAGFYLPRVPQQQLSSLLHPLLPQSQPLPSTGLSLTPRKT